MENKYINNELIDIRLKIDILDKKIDLLLKNEETNTKNCDKMGNHVDFVESIYTKVKYPLEYITNKFNNLNKKDYVELPEIDNKK
uniref:Uncharacterized protein n=1 Tax=viral metagenome TaxID=1070528 RepID=A0A6C0J637_9ZZZZ